MKTCIRCREDCSNRARVRDPEGRYICRSCLDAAVAEKQRQQSSRSGSAVAAPKPRSAPRAPAPASAAGSGRGGGVLAGQVDDVMPMIDDVDTEFLTSFQDAGGGGAAVAGAVSVPAGRTCMACSEPLFGDAVVCMHCGYNSETGRTMRTRKMKAQKEKRTASERHPIAPILTFVITSALYIGLTIYRWDEPQAIGLAALGFIAVSALIGLAILVCAFLDSVVQGLLTLFVPPYAVYWVFFRSGNGWLMSLFGISTVVWGCLTIRIISFALSGVPEG